MPAAPAQRDRQRRRYVREPGPGIEDERVPARDPQPERRGYRMQREGARHHRRAAVLGRQRSEAVRDALQVGHHPQHGALRHRHGGGVEDVLAGRSAVHVIGSVRGDPAHGVGEPGDQCDDGVGVLARRDRDGARVDPVVARHLRDRCGRGRWDDPDVGLRAGQRGLGIDHRLHPRVVADEALDDRPGAHRRQQPGVGVRVGRHQTATDAVPRTCRRPAGSRASTAAAIASASPRMTESTQGRMPAAVAQCTDSVGMP